MNAPKVKPRARIGWKTTTAGSLAAAATALTAAAQFDWMTPIEKHYCLLAAFLLGIIGPLTLGFFARDNAMSDQQVGLRPEPPKPMITVKEGTEVVVATTAPAPEPKKE